MPGNWVSADLTFQTSSDGIMYNDIFQPDGTELMFRVIAGTGIIGMRLSTGFVKFRSGTRERPEASGISRHSWRTGGVPT
jgi:hypothetical protein